MAASVYTRLPSKFDFHSYYLNQAAGGPSFPVYRARQHGGSFLAPLIRRHGIPFLKWIGRQAATLATGVGNRYLEKGSLDKSDMKNLLKSQGKMAAKSALDNIKQQIGAGPTMNFRRDGRLSTLIPTTTKRRDGVIAPLHGIRPPLHSEYSHTLGSPPETETAHKVRRKKKKGGAKKKSKKGKTSVAKKKPTEPKRKARAAKPKKKLNAGLRAFLDKKKAEKTIFT